MKKKGLSFEEKRQRMLSIFTESYTFFHIKDIEKLAPKKGIVFQVIKDVLQSLVGDDLVESDKIGSSVYYWSFPSKVYNTKKSKELKFKKQIEENIASIDKLTLEIKNQKSLRVESNERIKKLRILKDLKLEFKSIDSEINEYLKNDPNKFNKLKHDLNIINNINDTYIDNLYTLNRIANSMGNGSNLKCIMPDEDFCGIFEDNEDD